MALFGLSLFIHYNINLADYLSLLEIQKLVGLRLSYTPELNAANAARPTRLSSRRAAGFFTTRA